MVSQTTMPNFSVITVLNFIAIITGSLATGFLSSGNPNVYVLGVIFGAVAAAATAASGVLQKAGYTYRRTS